VAFLNQEPLAILAELLILFYLLGIYAAIHVLNNGRTSQGTIAWFVALLTMPYVAAPLYLVFGYHKFWGYVKARRAGDNQLGAIVDAILKNPNLDQLVAENQTSLMQVASDLARMPFSRGNRARLLVDGQATFEAIFEAIEQAEHYILVQFYILRDDDLGQQLKSRLIERRKAGVNVYLLYDDVGSYQLSSDYIHELKAADIEVSGFTTLSRWKNRFRINFRNHRKIVVVDGRQAFVGGHNVGDEYLGKDPEFGRWRDTHVALEGPVVKGIQLVFCEDWFWAAEQQLDLDWSLQACEEPGMNVLTLPSGPADGRETCTLFFMEAISSARKRLWIVSPYFVPDEQIMTALQLAVLRGVDVRIMLPAKADHMLVYLSSFSYLREAEQTGIRFFRYDDGFLHQKVMLVDDVWAVVGTANFDNRSFRINFEITMLFADKPFASEVEAMLIEDFKHCHEVTSKDFFGKPWWYRLVSRVARLSSPLQ
jgi:cardiolipin synthase